MRAKEFSPNKLVIFDIDDTLVHTQTKVRVIQDGKVVKELNSHDFTHYKLQPGEEFDFENFRNAQEFFNNSKPIIPMMNQLKQDIATGNKVVMVTARADFDDRELFLDTFRKYGVDMGKVHVYRAGNMTQKVQTEEKKKIIIRNLLDKGNYTKAIMYDDAVPNLTSFVELKDEYANTKFYAWHVSLEGEASEFHRTNETQSLEERKKKRKVRRAAYGPGPFGGYGYYAGYSSDGADDGGGGDGGGGESIRELFDGGKDWKWTYQDKNQASAEFNVGNVHYTFMAGQDPDEAPGDWDIEFAAKQAHGTASWGVTGTGNSAQVFGTVVEIMKAFIASKKASIRRMTFAAKEDSRQGLYARMVKRLLPKWNLEQNGEAFVLTRPGGLVFWVYSVEAPYNKIPAVKVKANTASEAEQIVLTTMPEFKGADLMGMGASKNKPDLSEVKFGGQDVEGNTLSQLKEKFPNLSTLLYFIPGLGQALVVADVASQIQMYNQAIDKIEKQYPIQTIQTVQQKVGDAGEAWDTLDENFADGRNPQDKGDSKRYNVPTKSSVTTLRKVAKQGGRKGQLAHWMANMKAGKAKNK